MSGGTCEKGLGPPSIFQLPARLRLSLAQFQLHPGPDDRETLRDSRNKRPLTGGWTVEGKSQALLHAAALLRPRGPRWTSLLTSQSQASGRAQVHSQPTPEASGE